MNLYGSKSSSLPQKITITAIEIILLFFSYWILFRGGGDILLAKIGIPVIDGNYESKVITFIFSLVVFFRMSFMMFFLLKRKIPWEETLSVPIAFALYFIGFSFFVYNRETPINGIDYIAIAIFILGSSLNTISELQRHFWKSVQKTKGNYTRLGYSNTLCISTILEMFCG